jgi:hypothetical protein
MISILGHGVIRQKVSLGISLNFEQAYFFFTSEEISRASTSLFLAFGVLRTYGL